MELEIWDSHKCKIPTVANVAVVGDIYDAVWLALSTHVVVLLNKLMTVQEYLGGG